MICAECGAKMHRSSAPVEETFRGERITLEGIEHFECDACGEVAFDAENGKKYDETLIDKYSQLAGLLSPREIRRIRKDHGLTQRDFERVLGVSSPSVSRWETGKVIPSKPIDLLMRAYRDSPELLESRMEQVEVGVYAANLKAIPFCPEGGLGKNNYLFDGGVANGACEGSFTFDVGTIGEVAGNGRY